MATDQNLVPVTVIGLGLMGSALAGALLDRGHPTTVWNRTAAKADPLVARGATKAASVADAVRASELVLLCVTDYPASQRLLDPVAELLAGRQLVQLSTGTPEQAREALAWATKHGAEYLDGAVMTPPAGVGEPDAVFFYSGSEVIHRTHRSVLAELGGAFQYLGADPGLASLYDAASLGVAWGAFSGYFHAFSLVATEGVPAAAFAPVANQFMASIAAMFIEAGEQVDRREYPGDQETLGIHDAALAHLIDTSRARGLNTEVPEFFRNLVRRAIASGHGADGIAAAYEAIR